jgi:hypothetical protein
MIRQLEMATAAVIGLAACSKKPFKQQTTQP